MEKKNLPKLIEAYAEYRIRSESGSQKPEVIDSKALWELVLLGDGPLKTDLRRLISDLRLNEHVHLPGFKQYEELPVYYGLAKAFVHASTTEQWGLVVNEAIASGLPVIVSNRCGCAPELVNGNGFTFDPGNRHELVARLVRDGVVIGQGARAPRRQQLQDRRELCAGTFWRRFERGSASGTEQSAESFTERNRIAKIAVLSAPN